MLTQSQIANIRASWSKKTCYPKSRPNWTPENPALGQCAVTALLVHHLLRGEIMYSKKYDHYWNKVGNEEIDLTREQFGEVIEIDDGETVTRDSLFASKDANTLLRYDILKRKYDSLNTP